MKFFVFLFLHGNVWTRGCASRQLNLQAIDSLDVDDLLHGELVDLVAHHAMQVQDLSARFAVVMFLGVGEGLSDKRGVDLHSLLLLIVELLSRLNLVPKDAASHTELLQHLLIFTAGEDANARLILGNKSRECTRLRMDDNQVDAQVLRSLHSLGRKALRGRDVSRAHVLNVVEGCLVVNASLSFRTDLAEEVHGLNWLLAVRSFLVEHDRVNAIEDTSRDITGLLCRRLRTRLNHAVEDLGGDDDRL